jgi:hypothetical protein
MVSLSDTRYKQRAVIEFLLAEKEIVGNLHKWLCVVYGSCVVDMSTVGRWVQRFKASGSGETWLCRETSWYREGMLALVSRWPKAVDVVGDYVKKITCVKETSSYTLSEFHTFWINCFREKQCRALLSEQPSYLFIYLFVISGILGIFLSYRVRMA